MFCICVPNMNIALQNDLLVLFVIKTRRNKVDLNHFVNQVPYWQADLSFFLFFYQQVPPGLIFSLHAVFVVVPHVNGAIDQHTC